MADVMIEVRATEEGFDRIQTELRQTQTGAENALQTITRESNESRRQTQNLREEMAVLNKQIALNGRAVLTATGADRQNIQEKTRALASEKRLLNTQLERQRLVIGGLMNERRAIMQTSGATNRWAGATSQLGTVFAGLGIQTVVQSIGRFAVGSVNAAVKAEGYMRSLTALYGSANIASGVFEGLNEAAQLPGITLEGAVQSAIV